MTMKLRNVPFSPPDMTEAEANEVRDAILSGWIQLDHAQRSWKKKLQNLWAWIRLCALIHRLLAPRWLCDCLALVRATR